MLAKSPKSAAPLDLDTVRRDLAEAKAKLTAVHDSEVDALSSPAAFSAWCASRDDAAIQVARLSKLAERIEADAVAKEQAEKQAALQKRVADQRSANEKLAARIRTEGGAPVETLMKIVHDVAAAAVVDEELNAALSRDAEQILGADYLARVRQATPREVVSEQEIQLWCFEENGNLIGDQDAVFQHSETHGSIRGAHRGIPAVRRKFKQIEFYPATSADRGEPLFNALLLPNMDGPGYAWGERKYHAAAPALVLEALEQIKSGGAERQVVMTELVPVEPFMAPTYRR
jgi:hypothetical protein